MALALFTSGFAGMTFTIVLLFLFQLSHGHLYQKIGVLTAAFMLGLASGGWAMKRRINGLPGEVAVLDRIVVALAFYACALPWLALRLSGGYGVAGELPFSVLNFAGGFLIALQFPLACRIYLRRAGSVAPAVGLLYAADLWGSVLGQGRRIWLSPAGTKGGREGRAHPRFRVTAAWAREKPRRAYGRHRGWSVIHRRECGRHSRS